MEGLRLLWQHLNLAAGKEIGVNDADKLFNAAVTVKYVLVQNI